MRLNNISRRSFLKLVGLGLAGGTLTACVPESGASLDAPSEIILSHTPSIPPSPTQAIPTLPEATLAVDVLPTPTVTSVPTIAPTHTLISPTAVPKLDVLTQAQKQRLSQSALMYVADQEDIAIKVARSLGYLENDGHPASVCGPLAAAILRDAGLLSRYTDLHEFWLLNPREGQSVLERNFPKEAFEWYQTSQSTAEFDFTAFPLKAGDFMYLFAGDPGSFEHMLTVSRVDDTGRAYSVTNFDTNDGYVIQEVMLYDPTQPGQGKLYDWTNRKNSMLGLTGFGGFLLLRFQIPVIDPGEQEIAFAEAVDAILEEAGGVWRIFIKEIAGPVVYARHELLTLHTASVIKVPIAMLFFNILEQQGITDIPAALKKGAGGRSYEQLLRAMLVNSEETATAIMERVLLDARLDTLKVLQSWGAEHTYIAIRTSRAHEMGLLLEGLFAGQFVNAVARQIILDHLAVYTPGDDTRLGVIRKFMPSDGTFYGKRGTLTDGLLVVADAAIVNLPTSQGEKTYVLAAFGYQGEVRTTYNRLDYALGEIAERFWRYTQAI
jgi:hypothetical protein